MAIADLEFLRPPLQGGWECPLPRMVPVEQVFPPDDAGDTATALRRTLGRVGAPDLAGRRIAITVGSRGVPHLVTLVATLVAWLRERGAKPFIVPAMGSHGGATAEGQRAVLESYGICEETVGAPIEATMDTVPTGELADGTPLFCDRVAHGADGIVLFNKVHVHSSFKGEIESGLLKMSVIGLGKHLGAVEFHKRGFVGLPQRLVVAGEHQLANLPILFGVAVVQNAHGGLAMIEAVPPDRIARREPFLLAEAKRLMGRLLLPQIDVLIIDEIGKDIAGGGMDSNVTGRASQSLYEFPAPKIDKIVVLGLTPATKGNAVGFGAADFTTWRVVRDIDFAATYANVLSVGIVYMAKMPVVLRDDRDAIVTAIRTSFAASPEAAKVVRIRNTKQLGLIHVSESCLPDIQGRSDLRVAGDLQPMQFDDT